MPRGRTRAPKNGEEDLSVKERILDRTIFLISKKGTTDVSVREIAREAGVNVAAVNYYFSSKEQMFDQMAQRFLEGYDEIMLILDDRSMPAEKRLWRWSEEVMRHLADYPGILALMERHMIAEPLDPFGRALRKAIRQAVRKLMSTLTECYGPADEERISFKLTLLISALSGPFPRSPVKPPTKKRKKGRSARAQFLDLLFEHLRQ